MDSRSNNHSFAKSVMPVMPSLALIEGRHGYFLIFPHDQYIGRALHVYGEYSELEVNFLRSYLSEGDIVIDAGANIGALTVPLAHQVGMSGRVYAFEVQRIIYQMLCANVSLNGLWNVFTHQLALADDNGVFSVPPVNYAAPGNFGNVRLQSADLAEKIAAVPIDQMGASPKLIKIDVQGMELAVLKGARQTIQRSRPLLYVENDEQNQESIELIRSFDYDVYWHQPLLFNVDNYRRVSYDEFPRIVSCNMFAAPKELALQPDLRRVTGANPDTL
jgi:FkbM family methyltransferase